MLQSKQASGVLVGVGDKVPVRVALYEKSERRPFRAVLDVLPDGRWEWQVFVWVGEWALLDTGIQSTWVLADTQMRAAFASLALYASVWSGYDSLSPSPRPTQILDPENV